jgi:hypothetical protein
MSSEPIVILRKEPVPNTRTVNVTVSGLGLTEVTVTLHESQIDAPHMYTMIEMLLTNQLESYSIVNEVI